MAHESHPVTRAGSDSLPPPSDALLPQQLLVQQFSLGPTGSPITAVGTQQSLVPIVSNVWPLASHQLSQVKGLSLVEKSPNSYPLVTSCQCHWKSATSCLVALAMSKAHWMTCCVTKFWFNGSFCDLQECGELNDDTQERNLRMSIRHSVSKWVAAAVREERLAETAECPGSWDPLTLASTFYSIFHRPCN